MAKEIHTDQFYQMQTISVPTGIMSVEICLLVEFSAVGSQLTLSSTHQKPTATIVSIRALFGMIFVLQALVQRDRMIFQSSGYGR